MRGRKMYFKLWFSFLLVFLYIVSIQGAFAQTSHVQIVDKGSYFLVSIDAQSSSHSEFGTELGQDIKAAMPQYEAIIDSYIAELTTEFPPYSPEDVYQELMNRVGDIRPQVPSDYRDEVNALDNIICSAPVNERGDGKLSKDELWFMNLITDTLRETQCSALAVYGSRSATGKTMIARMLDWNVGNSYQLAEIQAVYKINNGSKTITTVGFLGYQAVLTGYNSNNVFVSILDSETGSPYSSLGKRSYVFDLRYALENYSTFSGVGNYMKDTNKHYAFNHIIFIADSTTAAVLENNFSGGGYNMHRALRYEDSELNSGIGWGFSNAVASVNSFMLKGNHDNFSFEEWNTARWASFKNQLENKGDKVTWEELKEIAAYDGGNGPGDMEDGDIYNNGNIQIVLFEPSTGKLEVAFHPRYGPPANDPVFSLVFPGTRKTPTHRTLPWIPLLLDD